jgi:hypothetical protein
MGAMAKSPWRPVPVLVLVLIAVLVSGTHAVAADPAVAPAAPTAPTDPGLPAPTVTPVAPADAPAAPPPPAAPSDADVALKRVLRSSCRDGLAEVRAHAGDPNATWAATVIRLCDDILLDKMQARSVTGGNEGRGRLVLWSSLYGIWLGIAADIMFEIDSERAVIVAPMVGLGAGIGLSLAATRSFQISVGEAWTIITGLDYGTFNGALWAGGLDMSDKGVVGTAVATSIAATSVGVLVANAKSPSAGDIELVRSSLLWGTVGGFLTTIVINPDVSSTSAFKAVAASMDAGFVVGVALANTFDVSRNRMLLIDAGALAGGLFGAGIAWLALGTDNSGRGLAGAALGGMLGGIAISAYATRNLDADDAASATAPSLPALLARDIDGRWRFGSPGAVPVFDGRGSRLIGLTFNAVGGLF